MDPSVVVKANLPVQNHTPVQVIVANGNILWTQAVTMNCPYQIQGHQFKSDFRVLELAGYDLILGCDWIFEFSLVGINLKTREFTVEKGERICFKDETLPNAKFLVSHKKMNKLLKKGATGAVVYVQKIHINEQQNKPSTPLQQLLDSFSDVFVAPSQLPPQRKWTTKFHSNRELTP
jgi:hypothetical protein